VVRAIVVIICELLLFDFVRRLVCAIVVGYIVNYYCLILSED